MEDAPSMSKIPKSECPDMWIRLPRHEWPKSWPSTADPVIPLERNMYGHFLARLSWKRQFEKVLSEHGWEKVPNWECVFINREKGLFLSVYVDDIKLAEKKQNINPTWKILMIDDDLERTDIILRPRILGMQSKRRSNKQRYCGQLQSHVWIQDVSWRYRKWLYSEKSDANLSSWSYDMEGHAKKCVDRFCKLANKTTQQLYKVGTPCTDDHQFREEEIGSVEELSTFCSQIVLRC